MNHGESPFASEPYDYVNVSDVDRPLPLRMTLLMPQTRGVVIQPLEMMIKRHHTLPQMPMVILPLEQ